MLPSNKTKIVCTIGPASESIDIMLKMMRGGMNVARLNFSHGDFSWHTSAIVNLRSAARTAGKRVTIMADLAGPKVKLPPPEAVACFVGQAEPAPKQEEQYYHYRSYFVRCSGFQPNFISILCEVLAFIIFIH